MYGMAQNLSSESKPSLCSPVPYGRSSTCASCRHKSLGGALLAVGDPAVEMDLLPRAAQGSCGPKPGEVAKTKNRLKKSPFLLLPHIASELPNTEKVHLTLQIKHRHSRLPGLMRAPHDKPYVFLWIRVLDSHFRSHRKCKVSVSRIWW